MGKGKQRIEMKRITDKLKCRVTFSKRRQGLFKKALELDTLCGSRTSVVSVSDAGTLFTAGSIDPTLLHHLLLSPQGSMGLEMLGTEELGVVLETVKMARDNVELLLKKKEAAAAADFSSKEPIFLADGAMASVSGASIFVEEASGYSGGGGSISGYAEIEDLMMEEINSIEEELMYLIYSMFSLRFP